MRLREFVRAFKVENESYCGCVLIETRQVEIVVNAAGEAGAVSLLSEFETAEGLAAIRLRDGVFEIRDRDGNPHLLREDRTIPLTFCAP